MKSLLFMFILFSFLNSAIAQFSEPSQELADIYSIDNYDFPSSYVEVSEEALPYDYFQDLLRLTEYSSFTAITESSARSLFEMLKSDRRARMKQPGGLCTRRRIYIQNLLRKRNIRSGKLYLSCPSKNGRLRLRDQVSGRYFTYSNFHDTNIVLVKTASGNSYRVMDLQFKSSPVSLQSYLAQIEIHQRIKPAKEISAGTCYWRISSPSLTKENPSN